MNKSSAVALVGCGRIAKKHASLLGNKQIRGLRLSAVCDTDVKRAQELAQMYQVPFFDNYHTMLQTVDTDIVSILTPSGLHAKHTLEIAPYKKHIVVEKPMALTLGDADAMIKVCDSNGVRLFVVKQNRYNPPVQKLKNAIEGNQFGKLVLGTVRVRWCRTQAYYDQDAWRGTWGFDGGVLANQASHHIDLLEWIMGDVESVFAKSTTALVDIETEDTAVVVLKFTNGALGIIEATTATRPKDLEGSISVLGEKGSVEIGGFAVNEVKNWNFGIDQTDYFNQFSTQPDSVYGFGHKAFYEDVVDAIHNQKKGLIDGLEGRKSLELISAIYESIETGKEVLLRFKPAKCRLGIL